MKNKKHSIKYLSKKYDELYNKADKLFKKYNPCKIQNRKCIVGKHCCCGNEYKTIEEGRCKYLTENGCSVKSLACKLWLCYNIFWKEDNKITELNNKLEKLRDKAIELKLAYFYRTSKEDVLNYLKGEE
jgi:hypothetical protein